MSPLLAFTSKRPDGDTIFIAVEHIVSVVSYDAGSQIIPSTGYAIQVAESIGVVVTRVNAARLGIEAKEKVVSHTADSLGESSSNIEPIDIACPACQARAGKPCTAPTNTTRAAVSWFHNAREDAAKGWA